MPYENPIFIYPVADKFVDSLIFEDVSSNYISNEEVING